MTKDKKQKTLIITYKDWGAVLISLVKSNSHQNSKNWHTMMGYHPHKEGAWVKSTNGVYELNHEFYKTSGGFF